MQTYIQTARTIICGFTPADADELQKILGDAEVMENVEPPYDFEKTKKFLQSFCIDRGGALACRHREQGKLIGYILFNAIEDGIYELGWIFNRRFWRQGYAYEAMSALIRYAFDSLGAHKVFAETIDEVKSVGLMKNLGLKPEGIQRQQTRDKFGQWRDLHFYGLLREEYILNSTDNQV